MKKITILMSILLWAILGIAQQSSWVHQMSGTTDDIYDIEMADQNVGYFVTFAGTSSIIGKTTNGGASWSQVNTGENLKEIFVFDENTLYICGGQQILYSNDGGVNFTNQGLPGKQYESITFGDINHGWTCFINGGVESTTDGTNWSSQTTSTSENLSDIYAVDANNVWACGSDGTIIHTSNGGASWTTQTSNTSNNLHSIYFVDQNIGYAVGLYGVILKTTNGGVSWTNQGPASKSLNDVFFLSSDEGYAVGNQGLIIKTTNGGSTWSNQISNTTDLIWSINFTDSNNGWYGTDNGTIGATDHGGVMCTTHADFTVNESCPGTISMTNTSTGNFLTGGPDYTWSWEGTQWSTDVNPNYGSASAGTYDILLQVSDGNCSDDTTVNWTVNSIDTTITSDEFCEADTYDFFGTQLTAPGVYYYTTPSLVTGCDSVTELILSMNLIDTTLITDEFCENSVYDFYGTDLTAPGTYYHTFPSVLTSCDSVIQLDLSMNLIDTVVAAGEFCQGGTFSWNGSDYTTPGTYYYTTQSSVTGCDSVIQLELTVNPTYFFPETYTICDGETYNWQGQDYTAAGTYNANLTTTNGCDSIYELVLTVNPVYNDTSYVDICAGDSTLWQGDYYSTTGVYTLVYISTVTGCDSTVNLDLTVNSLPQLVGILSNNSAAAGYTGANGEISLSTSYTGTNYWTTKGAVMFSGNIAGVTGSGINLGTNYNDGTYDIWSETDAGCQIKQGAVTFIVDNGTTKIVATPTYGNSFSPFVDATVEMTLYFSTVDIYSNPVILVEDGPTATSGGNVQFDNLDDGDYYVKSQVVDVVSYPLVVPIFFYDGPTVDSADIVTVTAGDILTINVNHPEYPDTTGSNTAGGSVDTLGGGAKSIMSTGLSDQIVILRNEITGEILSVAITDSNGDYFIDNVPDNADLELYVTSFEYQNWTPAGFISATNTHYTVNFIAAGDSVYPNGTTGLIELKKPQNIEFSIYPNPATDQIYFDNIPDNTKLEIFNLSGQKIAVDVRSHHNSLDISSFAPGVYSVVITTESNTYMGAQKFVKK